MSGNHAFNLRNSTLRSSLRKQHVERQKSPGRKTVSFCSNSEKKVSNVADCLQIMQNGTEMVKLRTNVRQFCRVFTLDADLSYIRWTPTNKKPHKARISVDLIKEVRIGRNTELFRATENSTTDLQDECAFSIIYGATYECLDLIALTPDDANIWVTGLMALTSSQKPDFQPVEHSMATIRERWLGSVFDEADKDKKGYISEKTTVRTICELNPRLSLGRVKLKVKEASVIGNVDNNRGHIEREQFVEIYKDISTRPEIYFLMVRYANKDYLSCEDLQIFLETEQGMIGVGRLFCEQLIEQYEPSTEAKEKHCMTVDGFTSYLLSKSGLIFDPSHYAVCHDMDRPFNEYFIAASYNTYLVEDQTNGPCSIDGYITALKRNCRFIELNIWDPLDENDLQEPNVCRSSTAVSKISFSSVLHTIRELAFEKTRYPLLMRLDVHLTTPWQIKACDLMVNILGDQLYQPKFDSIDWTDSNNIPTPSHFLGKIILVCTGYKSRSGELLLIDEPVDEVEENFETNQRRQRLCSQFLDLIPNFGLLRYIHDAITHSELNLSSHDIFSISESSCLRLIQNNAPMFGYLSRNFLLRVTPNITRVDSSNMNPQEFWNFGVNLCALNYQTPGLMMDLQEGKFAANGACGYVLKPSVMNDEVFSPVDKMPFAPQVLHLRIISAQQLPRPRGSNAKGDSTDAFVVVEVFGIPADCAEERTKTVRNDSFNPTFDESFQFEVCIPEIALVRFLILDDEWIGDDFIGQYTTPFECLQSGYRHIPLLNNEGEPLENSTLFVHVAVTNRRGGGKPKKRGMSVKRKMNRVQTGMKLIEIKTADELFKAASIPLIESIEMRNNLEAALTEWQEQCGIGPTGSMRQGLRLLHARITTAAAESSPTTPTMQNLETMPFWVEQLEHEGNAKLLIRAQVELPDSMQKCFSSLETLVKQCELVSKNMAPVVEKLSESSNKISEYYVDLPQLCEQTGLRGQKGQRAAENFAWNVRLLKAQFTLACKTQSEAKDMIQQVVETAKSLGVFRCVENTIKV
ncbi:Phosphoinositide phospholipase C [Aphelenchoides besseyi]|nr:Phosphoinositide phospholipase C [Aphelenchoides besseyi]